jgi:hypothetical protein
MPLLGGPIGLGGGTLAFDAHEEGGFVRMKCFKKLYTIKINPKTQI